MRGWFYLLFSLILLGYSTPVLATPLLAGPMVGSTQSQSSQIWVQTRQAAKIQVRYWPQGQPDQKQTTPEYPTALEGFYTANLALNGLKPQTTYQYEVLIDGKTLSSDYTQSLTTAPRPNQATDFKVLFGSCYFVNDEMMDLLNLQYGSGYNIFETMMAQKAQMMFWLGDNAYYGPYDLANVWSMNRRMRAHRRAKHLQPFLASMSHLAIWDDHDFGPNNSDRDFALKSEALKVFQRYWANAQYGLPNTPGVFFKTSWGDVDFFFTDNRYYRAPMALDDPDKDFFGPVQLNWLKTELKKSQATFKIIVAGSPVLNRYYKESYYKYPGEFQNLMTFLKEEKTEGVFFISGDRHHSDLHKMPRPDSYPLYNFTASPLTTLPTQILNPGEGTDSWRVPGTLVQERNFGQIEVTGSAGNRKLILSVFNNQGQRKWRHEILAKDLR